MKLHLITSTQSQIFEPCLIFLKVQLDGASRAIALFADDDFGHVGLFAIFIVVIIAVNEHDDVRILLDGAGFTQVAHHRALVGALLDRAVELRQRNHRALQLFGQHLQPARDFAQLGGPVVATGAAA